VKNKHNTVAKGLGFNLILVGVEAGEAIYGLNGNELRGRTLTFGQVTTPQKVCLNVMATRIKAMISLN